MRVLAALVVVLGLGTPARAHDRESRARALYAQGKEAYERGEYQASYDAFRESFQLSHKPALLYNIASALQGLKRPHDAAEALRSFLRLVPDDPDRPEIERRIATLEEEQRLLDAERRATAPPPPPPPLVTPPPPQPAAPRPQLVAAPDHDAQLRAERKKRKTLIAVVSAVGAAVLVGAAVGLGVGLTSGGSEPHTPSTLGIIPGTR